MSYSDTRKGRLLVVAGTFVLALALAALSKFQGDYFIGLAFGAAIGLIGLGVYNSGYRSRCK